MKVSKEFKFEAAHRLSDYEGKCARVHGHNYKVVVTVEGKRLDEAGILIDFAKIKEVAKENIVEVFDHKLILKEKDEDNRELFKHLPQDWIVWVDYNPTAENMAKNFLHKIQMHIPNVYSITVYETDDSYAEATVK